MERSWVGVERRKATCRSCSWRRSGEGSRVSVEASSACEDGSAGIELGATRRSCIRRILAKGRVRRSRLFIIAPPRLPDVFYKRRPLALFLSSSRLLQRYTLSLELLSAFSLVSVFFADLFLVADPLSRMRIDSDQSSTSLQSTYATGSDDSLSKSQRSSSADSEDRFGGEPISGGDTSATLATPVRASNATVVVPSLRDSPDHVPLSSRLASVVSDRAALPEGFEDLYRPRDVPSLPSVTPGRGDKVGTSGRGTAVVTKRGSGIRASRPAIGRKRRGGAVGEGAVRKKNLSPEPRDLRKLGKTLCSAADLQEIRREHSRVPGLAIRLPEEDERPWKAPTGWFTAYRFWFKESQICFPLPKLLVAYCEEVGIAMSQLCPAAIRNIVGPLVLAAELNIDISLRFFEAMSLITVNKKTPGTLYVSLKSKYGVITGHPSKTRNWIEEYFFVRVNEASVPDVRRPYRNEWSPTFGS